MGQSGAKRVLAYARLAMGFANVRGGYSSTHLRQLLEHGVDLPYLVVPLRHLVLEVVLHTPNPVEEARALGLLAPPHLKSERR